MRTYGPPPKTLYISCLVKQSPDEQKALSSVVTAVDFRKINVTARIKQKNTAKSKIQNMRVFFSLVSHELRLHRRCNSARQRGLEQLDLKPNSMVHDEFTNCSA